MLRSCAVVLLMGVMWGALGCSSARKSDGGATDTPGAAEKRLDTSRLPRLSGANETFASPATTIFTVRDSVAKAAAALGPFLADDGWQQYVAPFSAPTDNPNLRILSFKKGPHALSVFIAIAPAQGGKTSVQYTAAALPNDLPFPAGAVDIEFDPSRPHLGCTVNDTVAEMFKFFQTELTSRGWTKWQPKEGVIEQTEHGAWSFFVQEGKPPLMLTIKRDDDGGKLKVELKAVPAEVLISESQDAKAGDAAAEKESTDSVPANSSAESPPATTAPEE
jgi:hypothetical protein